MSIMVNKLSVVAREAEEGVHIASVSWGLDQFYCCQLLGVHFDEPICCDNMPKVGCLFVAEPTPAGFEAKVGSSNVGEHFSQVL